MKYIQNDLSRELTALLKKYQKTISADKYGIYIEDVIDVKILIGKATSATENSKDKLIIINTI